MCNTTDVVVTTAPPLLQTDSADVHTDISPSSSTICRSWGLRAETSRQSSANRPRFTGLTAETNSLAGNPQRAINVNVNGQSKQTVNTRIDGAQDAYPWLPANIAYVPPADAIESVNVVTNSFDAEQGMAGGAAVNVQIKSGTNQFHGGAHIPYRSEPSLRATTSRPIPPCSRRRTGIISTSLAATFGGPIVKDKLFFFGDYERTTQRQLAGPDTRTLPTAAMATGDFRNLPGNPIIYDPATGNVHGANKQQVSCNGVLNVICPSRIDPAAAAMVKLLQADIAQVFTTCQWPQQLDGQRNGVLQPQ